jgi:hypothetical protein
MELSNEELALAYVIIRHEALALRRGDYRYIPEPGTYEDRVLALDFKLANNFHKRNQAIR